MGLTKAQRYNRNMDKIFADARHIENERIAKGERPNPNLTSHDDKRLSPKQRKWMLQERKQTLAKKMK